MLEKYELTCFKGNANVEIDLSEVPSDNFSLFEGLIKYEKLVIKEDYVDTIEFGGKSVFFKQLLFFIWKTFYGSH